MTYLGAEQVEVVAQREGLEIAVLGGIELGDVAVEAAEDLVHVFHELHGLLLAHVGVKVSAEGGRYVVLSVGERSRAAVAVHDVAGIAHDAVIRQALAYRALTLVDHGSLVYHEDPRAVLPAGELIGHENTRGSRADDYNVIFFHLFGNYSSSAVILSNSATTFSNSASSSMSRSSNSSSLISL